MEREVRWTEMCLQDMEDTFLFYDVRNGNSRYSTSLYRQILSCVERVAQFPCLGHLTEYPNVRYVVVEPKYSVFYCFDEASLTVLLLWDNRRNPVRLSYLLQQVSPMNVSEDIPSAEQK